MILYYVNPADTSDWSGPYVPGDMLNGVTLQKPDPANDIYEAIEVQCGLYYSTVPVLTGPVQQPTTQAQETCVELPIEDVYAAKQRDISAQDRLVRYNAVDSSLSPSWWLIVTESARFEIEGIQGNWLQRQQDGQGWPSGVNAPRVGIYNATDGRARRYQITAAATWNTLYLEKSNHDQATGNATDASSSALDAAYDDGNGVWADVAAHDPADPAWGYPPTAELSDLGRLLGGV